MLFAWTIWFSVMMKSFFRMGRLVAGNIVQHLVGTAEPTPGHDGKTRRTGPVIFGNDLR